MKLRCSKCKKVKPEDQFSACKKNVNRNFRTSWCNTCRNLKSKAWREANPDKVKSHNTKYRELHPGKSTEYSIGVTLDEKRAMFAAQGSVCGICRSHAHGTKHSKRDPNDVVAWCADHDHKTGKFRGVLCQRCNHALGLVGDSVELLKKLIKYLEKDRSC